MAFSYGIADGTYTGQPTTASCFEKDGRLILDIRFKVKDPQTGAWFKNEKGYDFEINKRHWLTNKDGGFNELTINGLKEWAKGWNPQTFEDFYWFQSADAAGVPFGNLAAVGEVELNFTVDKTGSQTVYVHDPNRPRGGWRKALVPDDAAADPAQLAAKWGAKAKALFAATPKKVGAGIAQNHAQTAATPSAPAGNGNTTPAAPARPKALPARPTTDQSGDPEGWAEFPHTTDGAFEFFCSKLGEPYSGKKHDERWFALFDKVAAGKDPDQFTAADTRRLFAAVAEEFQTK